MKRLVFAIALLCAPVAFAGTCITGTLQSYISLGATGCQDGAVTFSGFTQEPGQSFATPISPSQVTVTPGGTMFMPSLVFTLNASATAGNLLESFFRFESTGTGLVADSLSLNGSATVDGAATGTEDICAGGLFTGNSPAGCTKQTGSLVTVATSSFSMLSDSNSFKPSSFFDIFVDLTADGGLDGTASLKSATVQITATPEPATFSFLLAGVAVMGLRRFVRQQNRTGENHESL